MAWIRVWLVIWMIYMSNNWTFDKKYHSTPRTNPWRLLATKDLKPNEEFERQEIRLNYIQSVMDQCINEYRITSKIEIGNLEDQDDPRTSKYGGTPLYSKANLSQWPCCCDCGDEMRLEFQLRQKDFPTLMCPAGNDVLQVFFCPNGCGDDEPEHRIIWLAEAEVQDAVSTGYGAPLKPHQLIISEQDDYLGLNEISDGNVDWFRLGISKCLIEGVTEDEELLPFIDAWERMNYRGIKVGGYPYWVQNAWRCCEKVALTVILQIEIWEGNWIIMACSQCGKLHTDYQGT